MKKMPSSLTNLYPAFPDQCKVDSYHYQDLHRYAYSYMHVHDHTPVQEVLLTLIRVELIRELKEEGLINTRAKHLICHWNQF